MINNLFSIFDPVSFLGLSLNWISIFGFILLILPSFWALNSPYKILTIKIISRINNELVALLKNKKINILLFTSLFSLIFINNTLGLFSFTFTSTRHLAVTLSLAFPLWLRFIIFRMINNMRNFLAHLVPSGTPAALIPFMVIIEIIRNVIRPITLSVRLAANMIAGHLLLTLLGNQIVSSSWGLFPGVITAEFLLLALESAVACIQAYVFAVLTTLYASEA